MLSTSGMLKHVEQHPDGSYIVATENGMLYPLAQAAPQANLIEANRMAFCKYMKMITLPKLRDSLREMKFEVRRAGGDRRARPAADRAHGRHWLTAGALRAGTGMSGGEAAASSSGVQAPKAPQFVCVEPRR